MTSHEIFENWVYHLSRNIVRNGLHIYNFYVWDIFKSDCKKFVTKFTFHSSCLKKWKTRKKSLQEKQLRKGLGCNCVYTRFPIDSWWFWRITHFVKSVNILKKVNVNILNRIDKWKKTFCLQKISTQSIFPRNYLYCFSRDLDWDALGSKDIFVRFRIMFISKFYISLVRDVGRLILQASLNVHLFSM